MTKAFVLSGGGARGCFQAGALQYLMLDKGIIPDLVVGTSTGSLQGLAVAQQDPKGMLDIWKNIRGDKDIYKKPFLNTIKILFKKSLGLYNPEGLRKIVSKFLDKDKLMNSKVDFYVGIVNLQTGDLSYINKKDIVSDTILSSCTVPVYFPPIKMHTFQWVDGGVRSITPLELAIQKGIDEIYVILCSPTKLLVSAEYKSLWDVSFRTLEVLLNEIYINDIKTTNKINTWIDIPGFPKKYKKIKITLIQPDNNVIDTLDFNPDKIKKGIQAGYDKAKAVIG